MRHTFFYLERDRSFVTNILFVDWFLLSKPFLKRFLSSPLLLREYDIS